jgi:hypothetical protein
MAAKPDGPGLEPKRYPVRKYEAAHGENYSFEAVLADLIDNSIDANASFVEVLLDEQDFGSDAKEYTTGLIGDGNLFALIIDDGKGIEPGEFWGALSDGYDRAYRDTDLGAFGVGMKASSLAQAYELTVMTKRKAGKSQILRLSSCLIKKHEEERIWQLEDLDPWMTSSDGFQEAKRSLEKLTSGTVVLLEGMHKLEFEVGDEFARQDYLDMIEVRARNYLGLTFHYYIEGTTIPSLDGPPLKRKVKIYFNGRGKSNLIDPLDPFAQHHYDGYTGDSKGTLCLTKKFDMQVGSDARQLEAKMWILPHVKAREDRRGMQNRMKMVRKHAGIADLQGAYVYRNKRLIEFAPERDPWKTMMTRDSHHNYTRVEIHLPPFRHNESREFGLNTSKTRVDLPTSIEEKLKKWAEKPGKKWHSKDPVRKTFNQRSTLRNGNDDSWPKCKYCEENGISSAETHTFAQCKERPRCPYCKKVSHGQGNPLTRQFCRLSPKCERCGSTLHDTEDCEDLSLDDFAPVDGPENGDVTPAEEGDDSKISIRKTKSGPLVSSEDSEDGTTLVINAEHPYYEALRALLGL